MRRFDAVLWDVDGTLLDFLYAQRRAISKCLTEIAVEPTEERVAKYSEINDGYWKRLELGEVTKEQLLVGRFTSFFEVYGIKGVDVNAFKASYERTLGSVFAYQENSLEICREIKAQGVVKQYVITNGITAVQMNKLRLSGFAELMDDIFISEQIGVPKPQKGFFDYCIKSLAKKGLTDLGRMLVVGDSLTSDIKGGVLSGIPTCWYRPDGILDKDPAQWEIYESYQPTFEISRLGQIMDILADHGAN
ncbi:MAG: YjjG family noncanonical pyrimidine nucleotidase [Lachnospiraceae bacterium]|nr:YjjG family noncanonical pyrimidine nucleotidase [Lachnospiraceae bacterium]